jgi:hypothetical protein
MKATAMRSVSLLQYTTEIVCALRPDARLVAVTRDPQPPVHVSRTLNTNLPSPMIAAAAAWDGNLTGHASMTRTLDPVRFSRVKGAAIALGGLPAACGAR